MWADGSIAQNRSNLAAGTYTVVITDQNNCTFTTSATITSTSTLSLVLTTVNPDCYGRADGSVTAAATGGLAPYTYSWGGSITSQSINQLSYGVYNVTVTDSLGCMVYGTATLVQPSAILIADTVVDETCNGSSDGSINIYTDGGTGPYSYDWGNSISSQNRASLGAGTYSVTITDAHGCTSSKSISITQPSAINISATVTNISCMNYSDGSINTVILGGTMPYILAWSPVRSDSAAILSLAAGKYYLTVSDNAGCTAKDSFEVMQSTNTIVVPDLGADTSLCTGNDSIILDAGQYTSYLWQNGSTQQYFTAKDSGTYWVYVTAGNGCVARDSIFIGEKCNDSLVVPSAFTPNNDGMNDDFVALSLSTPRTFSMHIYNRWGQLVFESADIRNGWDGNYKGTKQMEGVFIYYIQYSIGDAKPKSVNGVLTLLR
jgi:gliding motility-associated-like protein